MRISSKEVLGFYEYVVSKGSRGPEQQCLWVIFSMGDEGWYYCLDLGSSSKAIFESWSPDNRTVEG